MACGFAKISSLTTKTAWEVKRLLPFFFCILQRQKVQHYTPNINVSFDSRQGDPSAIEFKDGMPSNTSDAIEAQS
jgi:hypothetical protein